MKILKIVFMQSLIQDAKRLIVKVGSSLVTNEGRGLDRDAIANWAQQIPRPAWAMGKKSYSLVPVPIAGGANA